MKRARAALIMGSLCDAGVLWHSRSWEPVYDHPVPRVRRRHLTRVARRPTRRPGGRRDLQVDRPRNRSEEHTSELQSLRHLVCRLLLEKKKTNKNPTLR